MWPKYTHKACKGSSLTSQGYRPRTDLLSPTGWPLAAQGRKVIGKLVAPEARSKAGRGTDLPWHPPDKLLLPTVVHGEAFMDTLRSWLHTSVSDET